MKNIKNEKYYQFDSGNIFKYDLEKLTFYCLDENGEWIFTPSLISKFYDAASDYVEISEEEVNNIIQQLNSKKAKI